ncbi:MAG: DUF5334 family protein [Desulfuromonadales bacterium]|nr:DUF5334 family protein [Desulfuromonadales bacterium]
MCLLSCAIKAGAIDGYDSEHSTKVTIIGLITGNSISVGEEIEVFIWNRNKKAAVTIESMTQRGNDLELQVTDLTANEYFSFEIMADDPGLNELPHFDPGMPPPVPIESSPGAEVSN